MAKKEKTLQENFFYAAHSGAKDMSLSFIRNTLREIPEAVEWRDPHYHGRTGLILAAWNGRLDIVAELLKQGAPPDQCDDEGTTALMLACARGHIEVARLLLENCADPYAKSGDVTVLDFAGFASGPKCKKTIAFIQDWMNNHPQQPNMPAVEI